MGIENYNKIIDITFYGDSTNIPIFTIKCPRKGQKSNIQVTGMFITNSQLQNIEIKIKNLYVDLTRKKFTTIKVVAGYENNTVTIWGNIWYMYRESPGPESVTVINCTLGDINKYLTGTINANYTSGAPFFQVITDLSKKLGYTSSPEIETSIANKTLSEDLYLNESAEKAVSTIKERFNYEIGIRLDSDFMYCYSAKDVSIATKKIPYLSTPPQLLGDGENPGAIVTLTAPWNPSIRAGDTIECPATFYVGSKVNGIQSALSEKKLTLKVITLQFQFSTVASMNSMIIQGETA